MITVENLRKSFGPFQALKGVSFEVQTGDVVGFLGPNGAGKSTTMKILTGYLLPDMPDGGRATIDGLDVVEQSLAVRRRIGYLPESTPLYTEMIVAEYLHFVGEIRGVPARKVRSAVSRVVSLCGLREVTGKNILELSKGYKQRVGLAQAMIHEPDVLILDEPTSGLDPNQIVEVRDLITRLGEDHTVILSTHYLQEVEASCSRVIIVDHGEIKADDSRENLVSQTPAQGVRLRVRGPADNVRAQLGELLPGRAVEELSRDGDTVLFRLDVGDSAGVEEGIARLVVKNDWGLVELSRERASLEQVFRSLTTEDVEVHHA